MRQDMGTCVRRGVALAALAGAALVAAPAGAGAQIVVGTVLESGNNRPVMLATVALVDTLFVVVDQTLTEEDGAFQLQAPQPGSYWVVVDRLGYQPRMDGILELGEGGQIEVEFYLPPAPVQLEGITAQAQREYARQQLENQGFYEREEMGFGHHIGPEELERRPVFNAAGLLRSVPSVVVTDGMRGEVVQFRGRGRTGTCAPRILVDGSEIFPDTPLDDVVDIENIAGIEVYVGVASAPAQYLMNNTCGVLLIWTR